MMMNDPERISGRVDSKWDNGFFWITGDDGKSYICHIGEVDFKVQVGNRVKFNYREQENGKYPFAINVERAFVADHAPQGIWVIMDKSEMREERVIEWCRCSSCGYKAYRMGHFCPNCGVPMTKTDEMRELAKQVYATIRGEQESIWKYEDNKS